MKEKDYTLSVDVHISKEDSPSAKRWYSLKIYGHPLSANLEPFEFDLSNFRHEQALKVGKILLDAIWELVEKKDGNFWKE
jgi:hypothetical protein